MSNFIWVHLCYNRERYKKYKGSENGGDPVGEQFILDILKKELVVALGCTEPVAIALAAATARSYINGEVCKVELHASGNVIKNAKAVGIPGMQTTGLDFVAVLGVLAGDASKKLEVLEAVTKQDEANANNFIREGKVTVSQANNAYKLYIEAIVSTETDTARVVITDYHTNINIIEVNGEVVYRGGCENATVISGGDQLQSLTVDMITDFVDKVQVDKLDLVKKSIELNRAIGLEGLSNEYGLQVGRTIKENVKMGILSDDLATRAMSLAAAGSDARMAGSMMPVMANTGSGNQGIAVTLPVVAAGEKLGLEEEKIIRAAALSHLITIHIKANFGRLSALCGVTAAGMGASGAIVYLLGGDNEQIKAAIQNTIGNVSGMICDGAKAGCAMKVATNSNVAVQSALLAMNNKKIAATDGFIHEDVEKSIENFCRLGNEGTHLTDELILKLMLEK
jgi:L-cysteine desulfidase